MPHLTITLSEGKSQQFIQSLSSIVHSAMVETINCPATALYHTVHQVKKEQLFYLPQANSMQRSENIIFIQMTVKEGRTPEQKKLMYETISSRLKKALCVREEDIIITLTENKAEDWHLGRTTPGS